ncbi:hypothetical protein VUR80DRAFT_1014 [Thermomyces stellatus]
MGNKSKTSAFQKTTGPFFHPLFKCLILCAEKRSVCPDGIRERESLYLRDAGFRHRRWTLRRERVHASTGAERLAAQCEGEIAYLQHRGSGCTLDVAQNRLVRSVPILGCPQQSAEVRLIMLPSKRVAVSGRGRTAPETQRKLDTTIPLDAGPPQKARMSLQHDHQEPTEVQERGLQVP